MKKLFLAAIVTAMAAVLPAGVFAAENTAAEYAAEAPVPETAALEDLPDNGELFRGYFEEQFYGKKTAKPGMLKAAQQPAGSRLTGMAADVYSSLLPQIRKTAAGERTNTVFSGTIAVPSEYVNKTFTAVDLGIDSIMKDGKISWEATEAIMVKCGLVQEQVVQCLMIDCPYDLYWFDKTAGYYIAAFPRATTVGGEDAVYYEAESISYTAGFIVAEDYAAGGAAEGYTTDPVKTSATAAAAANAKEVVENNKNRQDYGKIEQYKQYICNAASYNDDAAGNLYHSEYGDPWQLIWVFDENPNTEVVCEGYAKAFQYLCDLSTFNAKVICRTVTGTRSGGTGAGGHMWNVLQIGGKNYLVDVTNSDTGTVGADGSLFMVGKSGNTHLSYTFGRVTFTYDDETKGIYTDAERRLHTANFSLSTYIPDLDLYPGKAVTCTEDGIMDYYSYEGSERWFSAKDESTLIEDHSAIAIQAAGHKQGQAAEENRKEATCSQKGRYDRVIYCTACGKELNRETVELGLIEHTPGEPAEENRVEATETEDGSYDAVVYCTVCGTEISRKAKEIPALGHDYGSWMVSRKATCSIEGEEKRVCSHDKKHIETRTVAKLAHSPAKAVTEKEIKASCTAAGSYDSVVYCSVCKAEIFRTKKTTAALGHKFGLWTYKDASSHSRVCANDKSHIEKAAHTWNAGIVTKAPTVEAEGVRTYTCTVCGGTKTEALAKRKAGEPASPEYAPALEQTEKTVLAMKGDEAPAGSSFGLLKLRASKVKKNSVKLQWNTVKGTSGYVIYGSPCGSKYQRIAAVNKGTAKTFTVKKLKKNKYYKFFIAAAAQYNGQTKVLAASKSIHAATAGGKKGNYKTLTLKNVKKNKLTLKVKKKYTIKVKLAKSKKVKVAKHRAVCFESSDSEIASVSAKGKITAKKAGKCSIYVYAQNGIYKTIHLTVK